MMEITRLSFLTVVIKGLCTCAGRLSGGNAEARIYANIVSFFAFKSKPATQKTRPLNKHTETFSIHAL